MQRSRLILALLSWGLLLTSLSAEEPRSAETNSITYGPHDWPWWRGPNRDGVADPKQTPPLKWSATENVVWKAPVPGRGHGSPIVVGDRIFMATADTTKEIQWMLCMDRTTGKELWRTEVHRGAFEKKGNAKSCLASSTPACDGQRVFINFFNGGAIYTTALSVEGKQLWQTKISNFVNHQGFGSSPALYGSLVIVSADNKGGGVIAGLDRVSGKIVWQHERPKVPNYASPIILKVGDRDQMFMIGCDLVSGYDPVSGKKLWEVKGSTTECVISTVTDGKRIFTSGGYPKNHLSAVSADGTGKIEWENATRVYVPSLLTKDGYLYAVLDAGVAMCWRCSDGKEMWKGRLGGTFSSSPVLVGDHIFAINEGGKCYIFKAQSTEFETVGENQLGDEVFATPTFCKNRIYLRVATTDTGKRQEYLYCLGKKD